MVSRFTSTVIPFFLYLARSFVRLLAHLLTPCRASVWKESWLADWMALCKTGDCRLQRDSNCVRGYNMCVATMIFSTKPEIEMAKIFCSFFSRFFFPFMHKHLYPYTCTCASGRERESACVFEIRRNKLKIFRNKQMRNYYHTSVLLQ